MRRSSAADRSSHRRARRTAAPRWRVRMASRVSIAATSVTATAMMTRTRRGPAPRGVDHNELARIPHVDSERLSHISGLMARGPTVE